MADQTLTHIGVEGQKVLIAHDRPVMQQWLSPVQAREMAAGLTRAADEADKHGGN